jgi:hypothetical protein
MRLDAKKKEVPKKITFDFPAERYLVYADSAGRRLIGIKSSRLLKED